MTQRINAEVLEDMLVEELNNLIDYTKEETSIARQPKLVILSASDDKASERYIENKINTGKKFGINVEKKHFDNNITTEDLKKVINRLNEDITIDGIILQLPIYEHLNQFELLNAIDIHKDVDGLSVVSKGFLAIDDVNYMPCTPLGVMLLLQANEIETTELDGKNVVIVGRGETSGGPMAIMFKNLNCNVTILHSKTTRKDLQRYIENADIVVSCVGKRYLINADWFKEGSIAVGVGFTYDEEGKQRLDFEVEKVEEIGKASYVTARTNATGKATVLGLLYNTVFAYQRNAEENYLK